MEKHRTRTRVIPMRVLGGKESDLVDLFTQKAEEIQGQLNPKQEDKMETKSRYEIIADLEEKKAELINKQSKQELHGVQLKRCIEIAQEDLKEFENGKEIQAANFKDQLESIEKSLERMNTQKK